MTNYIFGIRTIIEAIEAGREVDKILLKRGSKGELIRELTLLTHKLNIPVQTVPIERIDRVTRKNHQGVLAFLSEVEYQNIEEIIPALYEEGKIPLIVLLDRVSDVRNFGAITRTAECAGAHAIVVPQKGGAQINADAVKTSAGALNHIPVCRPVNIVNTIKWLKNSGLQIIATSEKASSTYYEADFRAPTVIVIGAEDKGIAPEILRFADSTLKIPVAGKVKSLNVSVAAAIMLYEAVRQRTINN